MSHVYPSRHVTCHKTPPPPPSFLCVMLNVWLEKPGSQLSPVGPRFSQRFSAGGAGEGATSGGLSTRRLLSRSEAPGARVGSRLPQRARTTPSGPGPRPSPRRGRPGGGGGASQRALSTLPALVRGRGAPWAEGRQGPE